MKKDWMKSWNQPEKLRRMSMDKFSFECGRICEKLDRLSDTIDRMNERMEGKMNELNEKMEGGILQELKAIKEEMRAQ